MADVKWIKLTTDMFDNRKIKHLRRLPDGNNIVLLWIMLLTMAGRCNAGGMIFLTENIPYTPKMLADELGFEENTVILGIQALDSLNMVVTDHGHFKIAGWEEYQNIDRLAELREKDRDRKRLKRAEAKALTEMSATVHGQSTDSPHTDKDKEKEKELELDVEIENNVSPAKPPKKHKYGEFKNVLLTDKEYAKLQARFPTDYEAKIETLSKGKERKGYTYKSDYLAVIDWAERDSKKVEKTASSNPFLDMLKE